MTQTKNYAESVLNAPPSEKNQTPIGTNIDFCVIMKETKNAELIEEKEKKLHSKNFIIHDVEEPSSVENDDAIKFEDVYITNFIAALKVTYCENGTENRSVGHK